ncbi:hypothetical protein OQA88_10326 [Cercophora sp. LCS_1]
MNLFAMRTLAAHHTQPIWAARTAGLTKQLVHSSHKTTKIYPSPRIHDARRNLVTLAIETSCDDTCVAVLEKTGSSTNLHFSKKLSSDNRPYRGILPTVAVLSHEIHLASLVKEAIRSLPSHHQHQHQQSPKPDFVTVTRGPGIPTGLAVGLNMAKGLSAAWNVPLLAVNHMQAHALTPRLVSALSTGVASPTFPFFTLLVSGGHTQLVLSRSVVSHSILATTDNIAIGNMLDHSAREVLPRSVMEAAESVHYGAMLEEFAYPGSSSSASGGGEGEDYDYAYSPPEKRVDELGLYESERGWFLTPPLQQSKAMAYNFSGLSGQVQRAGGGLGEEDVEARRELARAAMRVAFEHLASRVVMGLGQMKKLGKESEQRKVDTLVVSGGVASNRFLMHVLRKVLDVRGFERVKIVAPPIEWCTDNAAMIAWTGMEMWEEGWESKDDVVVLKKWTIDKTHEDGGILGADGCNFVKR